MPTRDETRRAAQSKVAGEAIRAAIRALVQSLKGVVEGIATTLTAANGILDLIAARVQYDWHATAADPTYVEASVQTEGSINLRGFQRVSTRPHGIAWRQTEGAAAGVELTIDQAAQGPGTKLTIESVTVTFASTGAPTPGVAECNVRAGGSGGAIIWRCKASLPAVAGSMAAIPFTGYIELADNQSIYVETVAVPANVETAVSISGRVLSTV